MPDFPTIPATIQSEIADFTWHTVTEGESSARVFRLLHDDTVYYLKISSHTAHIPVKHERDKLNWLSGKIAVPEIIAYAENESHQFLLMTAIAGLHPMHDDLGWSPQERINFLASAANEFHALSPVDCPDQMTLAEKIDIARKRIPFIKLKPHLLHEEFRNHTPETLFKKMLDLKPDSEDLVVVHGDLYPVNIRAHSAQKSILGYIDVGGTGIADRYTDLARIANAIRWHFGTEQITDFFAAYGIESVDADKLLFYQLLSEFV